MLPTVTRETATVRLYETDLKEAYDRFVHRMWPGAGSRGERDATEVVAAEADTRAPVVLFVKGGEVIGHLATLPVRLSIAGRTSEAHWVVGLMVVREYRNGAIAPLLVKKISETIDIGLTLHVEPAVLRIFEGLKWRHVGVIPQYVRVLNTREVARVFARTGREFLPKGWSWICPAARLGSRALVALGTMFFAGFAAVASLSGRHRVGATIVQEQGFDSSYVELAERVEGKFSAWVCRDERYLRSRYGRRFGNYRLLACREGERLRGYCLVKLKRFVGDPRMGDIRMGTIVDCVFDPDDPGVLDSLVSAAVDLCRSEGMDVVFCTASHREMRRQVRRNGFIGMRGTLHVAYHDRMGGIGVEIPLESWHVMRGDADADANC